MSKYQRSRGHGFEREVVNILKEHGINAARNLDQVRDSGGDISLPRVLLECKRRGSIAVYGWLDQASLAAKPGQVPMVVARGDRREAIVILRLNDAIPFIKELSNE